jgi:hypothetical protein
LSRDCLQLAVVLWLCRKASGLNRTTIRAFAHLFRVLLLISVFVSSVVYADIISLPDGSSCTYHIFLPAEPLPTPSGWTAPGAGQTQPSNPPLTIPYLNLWRSSSYDLGNLFASALETCQWSAQLTNRTLYDIDSANDCRFLTGPYGGTQYPTAYDQAQIAGICPAGYTRNYSSSCSLTSAPAAIKPADGSCNMIRSGNTVSMDDGGGVNGGDSDCTVLQCTELLEDINDRINGCGCDGVPAVGKR